MFFKRYTNFQFIAHLILNIFDKNVLFLTKNTPGKRIQILNEKIYYSRWQSECERFVIALLFTSQEKKLYHSLRFISFERGSRRKKFSEKAFTREAFKRIHWSVVAEKFCIFCVRNEFYDPKISFIFYGFLLVYLVNEVSRSAVNFANVNYETCHHNFDGVKKLFRRKIRVRIGKPSKACKIYLNSSATFMSPMKTQFWIQSCSFFCEEFEFCKLQQCKTKMPAAWR